MRAGIKDSCGQSEKMTLTVGGEKRLLYGRQFLAGPRPLEVPEHWKVFRFGTCWYVHCHPVLRITRMISKSKELLCLGHIFDPECPQSSDEDVLKRLASAGTDFGNIERAASRLAGRWLLFVRLDKETRLYPDAGGTRTVFYTSGETSDELWVGSQPGLLADALPIKVDQLLVSEFKSQPYANSWPGAVTPYVGVRQLLPNHFLHLHTGQVERFWPTQQLASCKLKDAAPLMVEIIEGIIKAATCRGSVALPLTAGYDSRVLFACAGTVRRDLNIFTIYDPTTSYSDVVTPQKLGSLYGVQVRQIRAEPCDESFWSIYRRNVSGMFRDPGSKWLYTFGKNFAQSIVLTGGMGEVARCFYYRDGTHPSLVSPEILARLSHFDGNSIAIRSFAEWLGDVPPDKGVSILDLFYWEHRVGNWLGMSGNAFDAVCEVVPGYNCRRLLEIALGVGTEHRKHPYLLFREICNLVAPQVLDIPFNSNWMDTILGISGLVPWRLKDYYYKIRLRKAGLHYFDTY